MDTRTMYEAFGISTQICREAEKAEQMLSGRFEAIDRMAEYNQLKVLQAFRKNRVCEADFVRTTGYGYTDEGRDRLERVYADIFGTEDALVRAQLISGTHAISTALFGNLRPGDEMLSPVGKPYDTLDSVIGLNDAVGSLKEYGISYRQVDLLPDYSVDYEGLAAAVNGKTRLVEIQRSRGYSLRPTLSVETIAKIIETVKSVNPQTICMVDNCYGEFTGALEPSQVGADLIAGSLIKNPGGGLAPIGGYIAGKKEYVERAAYRLTAPGLGKEIGANLGINKDLYQGLFLAPSVTASAMKGAIFAAAMAERFGFETSPKAFDARYDIIQAINMGSPEGMETFCEGIQAAAPVDSYVRPEASDMPGYDSPVVMAAGAFISGSSIELSADGPVREPYTVFFQGGLTWYHAKAGVMLAFQKLLDHRLISVS